MDGLNDTRKRLASLLDEVAVHEGAHRTLAVGIMAEAVELDQFPQEPRGDAS
jgi:hypothetical protein